MMRKLLTLVLLLCSLSVMAQGDKVYLKNGSLLRGELLKIDAQHLSIDIGEAEAFSISLDKLKSVRVKKKKTNLSADALLAIDSLNRALRLNKWMHQLRLGVINGEDGRSFISSTGFSADYTLFYSLKPTWYLGLGIGYDEYPSFRSLPVGLEIRKDWGIGPSPFFSYVRAGLSRVGSRNSFIGPTANIRGQEFIAFGIGQQWTLGRSAMFFTVGFRSQSARTTWAFGDFRSVTDWNLNRLDMKLGMTF